MNGYDDGVIYTWVDRNIPHIQTMLSQCLSDKEGQFNFNAFAWQKTGYVNSKAVVQQVSWSPSTPSLLHNSSCSLCLSLHV